MDSEKLERKIEISPAWDKRDTEPSKNYGIHCCDMRFFIKGKKGVVQFLLFTGWYLSHNMDEMEKKHGLTGPSPADLGYHSYTPQYENQKKNNSCTYLDGEPCYYDESSLNADNVFKILVEKGLDEMWIYLEKEYFKIFYPELTEE